MGKRVIIVASGETERRALPHLASHLRAYDVSVASVLVPPRNRALSVEMAERLIKVAWYQDLGEPPDKFVLLLDLDEAEADEVLGPFRERLPVRLDTIGAPIKYAYAQPHLEGWYFADGSNLRKYLGRALGNVDTSKPDEIKNPKLHLRHMLDTIYTSRTSEEIAKSLDAEVIAQRSPSFRGFLDAVLNGGRPAGA